MNKARPNFNIVESVGFTVDYEAFKEDFLDPSTRAEKVRLKHNMSRGEYRKYRNRVLEETGLKKKPIDYDRFVGKSKKIVDNTTHIQEKDGTYMLKKRVNNVDRYYGRYNDLDTARMVRDKLIESDWDDEVGAELVEKYANNRTRKVKEKAKELFPLYEFYYVHRKDLTVEEIREKMNLTSRVYMYLTRMIREKYNGLLRREIS